MKGILRKKTYNLLTNVHQPCGIILGGTTITGLSMTWSLGKKGVPVICVDKSHFIMCAFSRFCSSAENYKTEEELLRKLEEMGKAGQHKNIIFCESDEYLLFLDRHKEVLEKYLYFSYPLKISLGQLLNKRVQLRLAQEVGLSTPFTFYSDEGPLEKVWDKIKYPAFVKPLYSQTEYRKKGEIVRNWSEAEVAIKQPRFRDGYMIQEIIEGTEENIWVCSGYCDRNGAPVALFTGYKKRQIPKDFGSGTVLVSEENKTIVELTKSFLKHAGYIGCFGIEFKKYNNTEYYSFIEFNSRICMYNEVVRFSGINLAYISYCDFLGLPIRGDEFIQKDDLLWQCISDDFITVAKYYSKNSPLFFIEWVKTAFTTDVYGDFSILDLGPFICKIIQHVLGMLRKKG